MDGGGGTDKTDKIDCNPNLKPEVTEKPSNSTIITKLPPTSTVELDFYTQALKSLSFRSPYDSDENPVSTSGVNTLPHRASHFLNRHPGSGKRHKKTPRRSNIWVETEEYFRDLAVEDIERLERGSRVGFSGNDNRFSIPSLGVDDSTHIRYNALNQMLTNACENDRLSLENRVDRNGHSSKDVDVDGRKTENSEKKTSSCSGVQWLLGSRSKYLASECPSEKQKLLVKDAGLTKLLVACPVEGLASVCHYCSYGDPLNSLIKCGSCGVVVHKKCYGVPEDVDSSSWSCSWCKRQYGVALSTERPCLLCPKPGGALKTVQKRGLDSEEGSDVGFAHLFCCQWMPEVYLENTRTMEPVMNLDELKDTRRKLICYLCKVEWGACVGCSDGACRTSFHPICAREARHRMEIWGKLGCDEVELRAFCSKHSEIQYDSDSRNAEQISSTDDSVKDVASDIGVSPGSLNTILADKCMELDLRYKLLGWLKSHAHIGSVQKTANVRIGSHTTPNAESGVAEGACAVSLGKSHTSDVVPVKSVPTHQRTIGDVRIVKDDNSFASKDKANDERTEGDDLCLPDEKDPNTCMESLPDVKEEKLFDPKQHKDNSAKDTPTVEDEMSIVLARSLPNSGLAREASVRNGEGLPNSYIHPIIYSTLMQATSSVLEKVESDHSASVRENSQLEASSSHNMQATSGDWISRCKEVNLDQMVKARNLGMLELSPADELEGELLYYQHRILKNAVAISRISDDLISKVGRILPLEIYAAGKQKWDDVLVLQYNYELKEAKKQGRRERRHKEAQAVFAAAAASSRASSIKKDALEEHANQEDDLKMNMCNVSLGVFSTLNPRVQDTITWPAVSRPSLNGNPEFCQKPSDNPKERGRICEICGRSEIISNPILVCLICKVAVHLDCYRSDESIAVPWHCELCKDLFSSQACGAVATSSREKPCFVAECGLCGGTASAFRKSADGQWIHALCAEWVLESTYRRGQGNPIEGVETVSKGNDMCSVCRLKKGVCIKCNYGHCQSTFHPTCARSSGFYMTMRTSGGNLQHKAYCEKHSLEQRMKAGSQSHAIEEFKCLKQVRVELERLRLLCERIIKREKLKREMVLCSHEILATQMLFFML